MSATAPLPVQVPAPPQQPAAPPHQRKKSPWLWVVIGLLAALGIAITYRFATKSPAPATPAVAIRTATVTSGVLQRTTRLGGQTSARNFANVTAPIVRGPENRGDMVLIKLVASGARVKKGDVIAQIDAQSIQDHIDDLNDTIEAATADINKRRAEQQIEWEQLQQTLRVAKGDLEKARLEAKGAEVKTDIERQLLQLSVEEADAAYRQQVDDLKFRKVSQAADLRILQLTKERHMRHRDRHAGDLRRYTMTATMDGLAVMSPIFRSGEMSQIQLGDRVFPGQGFMKVVDTNSMQVEAALNQTGSGDIRVGQLAKIHLDAFPEKVYTGRVTSVGALAVSGWRQNYFIRTVPVRLSIDKPDASIIPDLSASADVVLESVDAKAIVPLAAVHHDKNGSFVYVKSKDGFDRRDVEVGLVTGTQAAIVSGVNAGDVVRVD